MSPGKTASEARTSNLSQNFLALKSQGCNHPQRPSEIGNHLLPTEELEPFSSSPRLPLVIGGDGQRSPSREDWTPSNGGAHGLSPRGELLGLVSSRPLDKSEGDPVPQVHSLPRFAPLRLDLGSHLELAAESDTAAGA